MKKIILYIGGGVVFSVFFFLILNLSGMTKLLYVNYEPVILHGNYVGETRAGYYLDFLYEIILPTCVLISTVLLYFLDRFIKYIKSRSKIGVK